MNPAEFLKTAAMVVGGVVSLPLLVALVRAAMFFGAMTQTVKQLQEALNQFLAEFAAEKQTVSEHGEKLAVLWDGRERRSGDPERRHLEIKP